MKIRSITCFLHPGWPLQAIVLQRAGRMIRAARSTYEEAGYVVQTARLATVPLVSLVPSLDRSQLLELASTLSQVSKESGFDYLALGPALPDLPASYEVIPDLVAVADHLFLSGMLTTPAGEVSLSAVNRNAEVVHRVARLSPDGFANLRFGAIANVKPGGPFFPAAYLDPQAQAGEVYGFALAIESADLAVAAVSQSSTLAEVRQNLITSVEHHARSISGLAVRLATQYGVPFYGIDFTLAPFPRLESSFGAAMEGLGVPAVGLHGSLAAAAFLTASLDLAQFQRAGFNGLMLPVLEDAVLAERVAQGTLGMNHLLLYSAVCGTGLDTIPLPGDITRDQIAAILLDVAALAMRLGKPLIARLMPVPGKAAGDPVHFDFPYFADSRVMSVEAEPLRGLLSGEETFQLRPRM